VERQTLIHYAYVLNLFHVLEYVSNFFVLSSAVQLYLY